MYDLIIRDGTIVRSSGRLVADIAIEDGKIAYVGGNPAGKAREEISAIGRFVMPGVIDTHVHFSDPVDAEKQAWAAGSREALRGGVTTVLDIPTTSQQFSIGKESLLELATTAHSHYCNLWVLPPLHVLRLRCITLRMKWTNWLMR